MMLKTMFDGNVDESKKNSTLRSAHTVSVFSITSPPVPGYFLRICHDDNDDDDDVITEFATSCPLLVL